MQEVALGHESVQFSSNNNTAPAPLHVFRTIVLIVDPIPHSLPGKQVIHIHQGVA